MKEKKKKIEYIDDGHTIYNMDVDGMPHRQFKQKNDNLNLSKKERKAIIKAALLTYMPVLFGVIFCFLIAMIIIYFWLK